MSQEPEINFLGDLARLQLQRDDVVVLRAPVALSDEQSNRVVTQLRNVLGQERHILILQPGYELGVLASSGD